MPAISPIRRNNGQSLSEINIGDGCSLFVSTMEGYGRWEARDRKEG